ncbi:MAG: hypothetical protein RH917_04540 [Lacipirellulaceae bacterium]
MGIDFRGRHSALGQWIFFAIFAGIFLLAATPLLRAQQSRGVTISQAGARGQAGRQVALRDQLRVGLKARTKSDIQFVDTVVLAVAQGRLPRRLVDSTFLWARQRSKTRPGAHKLRPMVYFQPALTLQARRLGVLL